MNSTKRGLAQNAWYEIAPQIRERWIIQSFVLERLANALRPKLKIGKKLSWYESAEEKEPEPERPADLMSIDYEVEDGLPSGEVLRSLAEQRCG